MDASLVQQALDVMGAVCRQLPRAAAARGPPSSLLAQQRALLRDQAARVLACAAAPAEGSAFAAAVEGGGGGGGAPPPAKKQKTTAKQRKRARTAVAAAVTTLALYPRITRLLNQLPPNVVTHATFFLTLRGLGALDTTCQRFHPVGLTQKACLLRANMWLPRAGWAGVARPALSWPRWLDEVRFRGRQRRRRVGRVAAGGDDQGNDFTLVVRDDGSVRGEGGDADR